MNKFPSLSEDNKQQQYENGTQENNTMDAFLMTFCVQMESPTRQENKRRPRHTRAEMIPSQTPGSRHYRENGNTGCP